MPHHLIIKQTEASILNPVLELLKGTNAKIFCVYEEGDSAIINPHWHIWTNVDWAEEKVRREVGKLRPTKAKGFSYRAWDDNLGYFCKGMYPQLPNVVYDNVIQDDHAIEALQLAWMQNDFNTEQDPDYKQAKILDELVEAVRDQEFTPEQVIDTMINLFYQRGGKKMISIKSVGQAYVRTALLFTKNSEKYKKQLHHYYLKDLF